MQNDMRDRLIELIVHAKRDDPETGNFTEFLANYLIENGVTIGAESLIKHGKWIADGYDCVCSICGNRDGASNVRYCPDCGAKMDGGKR